jgi:hypothetical protein
MRWMTVEERAEEVAKTLAYMDRHPEMFNSDLPVQIDWLPAEIFIEKKGRGIDGK